jgi:hypothetical protein
VPALSPHRLKEYCVNKPTPTAGSKSYTTWKLSFPLLDAKNQIIEIIEGVQEPYVGPDEFIVRVTREMDGATAR